MMKKRLLPCILSTAIVTFTTAYSTPAQENSPLIESESVRNLVYTVISDSLVALGWSQEEGRFEQVWASAPTRHDYSMEPGRRGWPIRFIAPGFKDSNQQVPSILGLDYYGLFQFSSHNPYPQYFPFWEVIPSYMQVKPWSFSGKEAYLVQRERFESPYRTRGIEWMPRDESPLIPIRKELGSPTVTWSLEIVDIDEDGIPEILTGGHDARIFRIDEAGNFKLVDTLPFPGTLVDVIRVGDVDGDTHPEIVLSGNSRRVTVYDVVKRREGGLSFPVSWQSENLGGYTQGLELADLSDKPGLNILVATTGDNPKFVIYEIDEPASPEDLVPRFVSDYQKVVEIPCVRSSIPGIAVGDLTGDGRSEIVLNGRIVYFLGSPENPWQITRTDTLHNDTPRHCGIIHPSLAANSTSGNTPDERWIFQGFETDEPDKGDPVAGDEFRLFPIVENVWTQSRECILRIESSPPDLEIIQGEVSVPSLPPYTTTRNADPFVARSAVKDTMEVYSVIVERIIDGEVIQRYRSYITVNPRIEAEWPLMIVDLWAPWAPDVTDKADVFLGSVYGLSSPDRELILAHESLLVIDGFGGKINNILPFVEEGLEQGQRIALVGGYFFQSTRDIAKFEKVIHAWQDTTRKAGREISTADTAPDYWPNITFQISEYQETEALIPAHGSRPLLVDENGTVIGVWWDNPAPGAFIAISQFPRTSEGADHEQQIIEALLQLIGKE